MPQTECAVLVMECVYLYLCVCVPILKMAVWLFCFFRHVPKAQKFREEVRCATSCFRDFRMRKYSKRFSLLALFQSQRTSEDKQHTSRHACITWNPFPKNKSCFSCNTLFQRLFILWPRYAPIHSDGPHRESRLGERRVAALNDRCLLSALQVSPTQDSLWGRRAGCNVDTMTDGPNKAGTHCSAGKNNRHHLSANFQASV